MRRGWVFLSVWLLVASGALGPCNSARAADAVERGAYIFAAAGCAECHTDRKNHGPALAGGRALKTPFGTFYSPNITPDPATGIGKWSDADFTRALREGIGPEGRHYFPVFPYPSFTFMADQDMRDLKAYLFAQPPVVHPNKPHEVDFPFGIRIMMAPWDWLFLTEGPLQPDPSRSAEWNRGKYLVQALGHCAECHTPRNMFGALDQDMLLAGSDAAPEGEGSVPNITPDKDTGIGKWSAVDITYLLETGLAPDGDSVGGAMGEVVDASTSKLTQPDRAAIAAYLLALRPIQHRVAKPKAKPKPQ